MTIIILVISAYLLLTIVSGFIGYKKTGNHPDDYFLAGRNLGPIVVFFTFVATNFSAFFFLGFAGEGYRLGYAYYIMMAVGTAIASLSFFYIGVPVWRLGKKFGFITPPELIGSLSQSPFLKYTVLFSMVFFSVPYMAIQPIGAGIIVSELLTGQVSPELGSILLTICIVIYVFAGGMRSIAITDMVQGILMFGFMALALYMVSKGNGGFLEANSEVLNTHSSLFSWKGGDGSYNLPKWISFLLFWALCVPMFPQMFMRFFVARTEKSLRFAGKMYALIPFVLFLMPVAIGVQGHLDFPGLEGRTIDKILPMMLGKHTPDWMEALILTGAFAAFMSTMDSQLLSLSSMLSRDLVLPHSPKGMTLKKQVSVGRIFVVLLAILALVFALKLQGPTIFTIAKSAFSGFALLLPAFWALLYFEKFHAPSTAVCLIISEILLLAIFSGLIPKKILGGFEPAIVLASMNFIVCWVSGRFWGVELAFKSDHN